MSIAHLLADFSPLAERLDPAAPDDDEAVETTKLHAFESGYSAGWDDAVASKEAERGNVSADLAQNLRDLSFTYHEAHGNIVSSMRPLIESLVGTVLPQSARAALVPVIAEQIADMTRNRIGRSVNITVAPENDDAVQGLLTQDFGIPLAVRTDPDLGGGQVQIRFGETERQIDLDAVLKLAKRAVGDFFAEHQKDQKHG